MPFLSGTIACTRFNIIHLPDNVNFDEFSFKTIQPGSTIREKSGFLPYELDETYKIGEQRWAFRVRIDKLTADPTLVKERYKELLKVEIDEVGPPSPKTKRDLRRLAEEELLLKTAPRTRIIECLMENGVLYAGTTAKPQTDVILGLMKNIGITLEYKTPWMELGQELESPLVDTSTPGESVLGCHFLKKLLEDPDVLVEPHKGSAKLVTPEGTKVSLSGSVLGELNRFLDEGAELISAKLIVNEITINFTGLSYQISGMKVEKCSGDHWTVILDERLDPVRDMWNLLDEKYLTVMTKVTQEPDAQ